MGSRYHHSQDSATQSDNGQIRNLIENGLLFDWSVKIEFENNNQQTTNWQQWDKSFYAIHSAEPVLAALSACYSQHPGCIVRINAEKFNPQTRMLYHL